MRNARKRERERDKEGGRESEQEGERDVEYGYRIYFTAFNNFQLSKIVIFKWNDGCLGPFSLSS